MEGEESGKGGLYMQVGCWIYHFTTIDCPGKGREGKAHEKGRGGEGTHTLWIGMSAEIRVIFLVSNTYYE